MFLARLSLNNPVFVTMLTIALVVFGGLAVTSLGVELAPVVDLPVITVSVLYPGADAQTVEEEILERVEESVGTLGGIRELRGIATDNYGVMVIRFEDHIEVEVAAQDVRAKLATIARDLPSEADAPLVDKFDVNALPIMALVLQTPAGEDLGKATGLVKQKVKNRLQTLEGVGKITLFGARDREIKVLLDPLKLQHHTLPAISVLQLLGSPSLKVPAGSLKMRDEREEVPVVADAEVDTVAGLRRLPLFQVHGNTVRLSDLGRIVDGLEEEESIAQVNGTPAIAMEVQKRGRVNVVELAARLRVEMESIRRDLPPGYRLDVVNDNTPFVKAAVASSVTDIFLGALLAMVIIFGFLMNKRAAIIISITLPTSIVGTFAFVYAMGYTLNILTTLALSLSVGIVTDDAIVVIEAIFRHVEKGKTRAQACIDATQEVGLAVMAATFALVCVFGPAALQEGIAGIFFSEFGMTVAAAILISLLVSFTVIPLLSSVVLREEPKSWAPTRLMDRFLTTLDNGYAGAVAWVLRHRAVTILVALLLVVGGAGLATRLKTTFMPSMVQGEFDLVAELPNTSSLEQGKRFNREVVAILGAQQWVKLLYTTIGGGRVKETNVLRAHVVMQSGHDTSADETARGKATARELLAPLAERYDAKVTIKEALIQGLEGGGAPVQAKLLGDDLDTLRREAARVAQFMRDEGGFVDVTLSEKGSKKQVAVSLDHDRMVQVGVNPAETAIALRYALAGLTIGSFAGEGGQSHEVRAYLDERYRSLDAICGLPLKGPKGDMIRLGDIATIGYSQAPTRIERVDRTRCVSVNAAVAPGYDLGGQSNKLRQFVATGLSDGVRFVMGGRANAMDDTFTSMMKVLFVSIFLIYLVLASQFNSFIHPLTIMSALPFALTGAILTLWGLGIAVSVVGFIGFIMLMGIVTKNSILLVDYALQRRAAGDDLVTALVESSRTRLRPILMTAGGTIFGMLPIIISTAPGAEFKHSMGWAVVGGLIFSTGVTLFVVPVLFSLFERLRRRPQAAPGNHALDG